MKRHVVFTKDGSTSIYNPIVDEHYHSIHGAVQESEHVFINAGLLNLFPRQNKIAVLEIGFGTGLNAILTYKTATEHQITIDYTAIEKYPLLDDLVGQLNYTTLPGIGKYKEEFKIMHDQKWNISSQLSLNFSLHKMSMDIQDCMFDTTFDLIYFDAFAPSAQPELWSRTIIDNMYKALKNNGILVTYCAKGIVKRTMKEAGFFLETIPGPIGKREMTRAIKSTGI